MEIMMDVFTCCGLCGGPPEAEEAERQPLLPEYHDDTSMQAALHQKIHTYQMLRALSKGYMPSNQQLIVNLRTLLASDVLNPENLTESGEELSESGRALVHYAKEGLKNFIEILQHKNADNQIQDFIWYLSRARLSVDVEDIANRVSKAKSKANTAAAYKSLQTVGSLLLTNSDFRVFLGDLTTIGREVFSDTALKLSAVSKETAKRLEPSQEEQEALLRKHEEPNGGKAAESNGGQPKHATETTKTTTEGLGTEISEVTHVLAQGASEVAGEAQHSLVDHLGGDEKDALLYRLKNAVTKLRRRGDYSDSVSTLSLLLKRYAMVYSHVIQDTLQAADEDVSVNRETDVALNNFWSLIKSFGDAKEWEGLEATFRTVMEHSKSDPQFDELVRQLGNAVQELLTDPAFFDHAEERFQELRKQSRELASGSSLRDDIDALLAKLQSTVQSVLRDKDISMFITTLTRVGKILSPANKYVNTDLITDLVNIFAPLVIQAIQYVPIPRLEVSTPEVDLLLENLILEPGRTINGSSFLPFRLRVETRNDFEVRKARTGRTASAARSLTTIKLDGLSIAAGDVGFWLRAHSGALFRFADEGIASFRLDERGIDVHLDIEVGRERLEEVLTLRAVRVVVHELDYTLRKSRFSLFAWLFKPLVLPMLKKAIELQIATSVADFFHAANRELLYARERLRATRIADPDDFWTFVKAVAARLVPEEDPDFETRVGIDQPGKGVFKGVYAPGSLVKLWEEEAAQAKDRIRDYEREGWRNNIFDVPVVPRM